MAITSGIALLSSYNVPNAQASAATIGGGVLRFRVDQATVTNYTGTAQTLTVYVLQSGDSVANLTKAIDAMNIPAGESIPLFELIGRSIDTGGAINAFSSSSSSLSLNVTGTNYT